MKNDKDKSSEDEGKRLEFEINGEKCWMDFDAFKAQQEWMKQKEKEYLEWWYNGGYRKSIYGE